EELDVGLIRARSPQAKGRIERLFGTAQDRWVKQMRLLGVRAPGQANEAPEALLPEHNRRLGKRPKDETDAPGAGRSRPRRDPVDPVAEDGEQRRRGAFRQPLLPAFAAGAAGAARGRGGDRGAAGWDFEDPLRGEISGPQGDHAGREPWGLRPQT